MVQRTGYHHALRMDTRTNRVRQRLDIRLTVFERHMTNDCVLTDYKQDRNTFLTNTDRQNVTLYQLKKKTEGQVVQRTGYHHALRMDTRTNRVRQRLDIRLTVFKRQKDKRYKGQRSQH